MGCEIRYHENGNWFELVFQGEVSVKTIRDAMDTMRAQTPLGERRDTLVVFKTHLDIGFLDIFSVIELLKDFHIPTQTRVAVVREKRYGLGERQSNLRFFSNVLFNRGWQMEVFDERQAALNWLGVAEKAHQLDSVAV